MAVFKRRRNGKESDTWYVRHPNGNKVNTGLSDKRLAEREEVNLRQKWQEEKKGIFRSTYRKFENSLISANLLDYSKELTKRVRSEKHHRNVNYRIKKLQKETGWTKILDINSNSFISWRAEQDQSSKTLNEFLSA